MRRLILSPIVAALFVPGLAAAASIVTISSDLQTQRCVVDPTPPESGLYTCS
ncbi:MAG: hypothetical protein ACE5EO_10565 [Candidatus Krumholzibacteriia bacterium]